MTNSKQSKKLVVTRTRYLYESLLGYALRLAFENGYGSANILRKLFQQNVESRLYLSPEIATDKVILEHLEELASLSKGSLTNSSWNAIDSASGAYFNILGVSIPTDAVMTTYSQVCPQCLIEYGFINEEWDLSGVTVCTLHGTALVASCPQCYEKLKPVRVPLSSCSHCHADLRFAVTQKIELREVTIAQYLAALAPYRLKVSDGFEVDSPESLFAIAQVFSFDTRDVLQNNWSTIHFKNLSVDLRRKALQNLADALVDDSIDGILLHKLLLRHIVHRLPFMPRKQALSPLSEFLNSSAFLSPVARRVLNFGAEPSLKLTAVDLFGGRPPQFYTAEEVIKFLGCSEEVWHWLLDKKYLTFPEREMGFDADQVLNAQNRLSLFFTFDEMDSHLGISGLTQRFVDWGVLRDSTGHRYSCKVIDILDFGSVIDNLRLQSLDVKDDPTIEWIQVTDTALGKSDLAEAYALFFASALRSDLRYMRWQPPYSLKDLWLTTLDSLRLMSVSV